MSGIPAAETGLAPTTKDQVARTVVREVQKQTVLVDSVPDVWQQYWDAVGSYGEYEDDDPETGNPTDPALIAIGITKTRLLSCVTLLENLKHLVNNEAVSTNTYRITINDVRHLGV